MDGEEIKAEMEGEEEEQDPAQNEEDIYKNLDAAMIARTKEIFQIFDKEQQQFVDVQSLGTLLRWLRFNPTESEMKEYVRKYDQ